MRFLLAFTLAASAWSQTQTTPTFRESVNVVVAPVTVKDREGQFVNGLAAKDFKLLDNFKAQDIKLDESFVPISMVVAIQANNRVEAILPQIKKIGPLLEGLVIGGSGGEAAILAFDHRMQTLQEFTNDGKLFRQALEKLRPGSTQSAMIDAVFAGTRMLRTRPANVRRILLLISETRDRGSEGRMREALLEAQLHNVIIYTININRFVSMMSEKGQPPKWDNLPPGSRPRIPGAPMTPQAQAQVSGIQGNSANLTPLVIEVFRQAKAIFFDNQAEVFTHHTGGREYSFINTSTLEKVMTDIGEELHSQYVLSYNPNNKAEGGWHEIKVEVARFNLDVRTRPGYWMASVPQ